MCVEGAAQHAVNIETGVLTYFSPHDNVTFVNSKITIYDANEA